MESDCRYIYLHVSFLPPQCEASCRLLHHLTTLLSLNLVCCRIIIVQMKIPGSCTNAGYLLRKHYEVFLQPFLPDLMDKISDAEKERERTSGPIDANIQDD